MLTGTGGGVTARLCETVGGEKTTAGEKFAAAMLIAPVGRPVLTPAVSVPTTMDPDDCAPALLVVVEAEALLVFVGLVTAVAAVGLMTADEDMVGVSVKVLAAVAGVAARVAPVGLASTGETVTAVRPLTAGALKLLEVTLGATLAVVGLAFTPGVVAVGGVAKTTRLA